MTVLAKTSMELLQKHLDWNEKSKGILIAERTCGILVILGGPYMIYTTV